MTAAFDVLVVGSDEASLCAAACAARGGARVGLLRQKQSSKSQPIASISAVPNAVWRRLDLQDFGVSLDPVSARATLLPEDKAVVTYDSARKTGDALAAEGVDDHLLWSAFLDDMKQLKRTARLDDMTTTGVNGTAPLVSLLEDTQRLAAIGQVTGSCTAQLDDYFSDPELKAHLAAHAMGRVGLGGKELGAALELAEAMDDTAWRVRANGGNKPLFSALEKVCAESGVEFFEGTLVSVTADGNKHKSVNITGDQKVKTRWVFFATPEAAVSAGIDRPASPIASGGMVTALMRFKLKKPMTPPTADENAVFFILDDIEELQEARDSVIDGQLPETLPVEFEFAANGDVVARTQYCPKAFREENEWREWTGQDRQALAARITQRLSSRMKNFSKAIKKSSIDMIGAETPSSDVIDSSPELFVIQPNHQNSIGAAVRLLDKVLAHG